MSHLNISRLSVDVEAHVLVSFTVSCVQFADDLLGLHTRVLGQNSKNDVDGEKYVSIEVSSVL